MGTSAVYSQRTLHVQYIYMYISMQSPGMSMSTRVCSCVRVQSRARADDALIRGSRALFVRPSIDGTRTGIVHRYVLHACIHIHARLASRMNGSPMRTLPNTRGPRAASVRARVCDWARTHPRRIMRVRSVGVDRGWPRRAGVLLKHPAMSCVGVHGSCVGDACTRDRVYVVFVLRSVHVEVEVWMYHSVPL